MTGTTATSIQIPGVEKDTRTEVFSSFTFVGSKSSRSININKKDSSKVPPVLFTELFRFSTRFELLISGLALIAAAEAGMAAKPQRCPYAHQLTHTELPLWQLLTTLLFGTLTNQFVIFQAVINKVDQEDQQALNKLPAIATVFHCVASKDVIYFVISGINIFVCTYFYIYVWVYTSEVNANYIHE
ncbi:hypothetical protein EDD18DRAFT_1355878 [Armillaria luteobubalina]|uniref:Uncharacterized protein n=1 Tax=Armillaria luteobubalina TaxID=153913 RepID=A0AA39Q0L6_9AGAR|nr:hypothetical protein EDD18DRAFT_1355878 [Armillaria luteobubalina]